MEDFTGHSQETYDLLNFCHDNSCLAEVFRVEDQPFFAEYIMTEPAAGGEFVFEIRINLKTKDRLNLVFGNVLDEDSLYGLIDALFIYAPTNIGSIAIVDVKNDQIRFAVSANTTHRL
ncbi:hypothetical protein IPM19_00510 [bacterium]|nr:MAG: hypothetical protein IPM19_00510 [bacterium]